MGYKFKSDSIYEFDIDNNGINEVFKENSCMTDFSTVVYKGSRLLMSGGIKSNVNQATNQVIDYSFKINERSGKLAIDQRRVLPNMNQRRMNHSSIIIRDHLFVFFGYIESRQSYSFTVEYLDLVDN